MRGDEAVLLSAFAALSVSSALMGPAKNQDHPGLRVLCPVLALLTTVGIVLGKSDPDTFGALFLAFPAQYAVLWRLARLLRRDPFSWVIANIFTFNAAGCIIAFAAPLALETSQSGGASNSENTTDVADASRDPTLDKLRAETDELTAYRLQLKARRDRAVELLSKQRQRVAALAENGAALTVVSAVRKDISALEHFAQSVEKYSTEVLARVTILRASIHWLETIREVPSVLRSEGAVGLSQHTDLRVVQGTLAQTLTQLNAAHTTVRRRASDFASEFGRASSTGPVGEWTSVVESRYADLSRLISHRRDLAIACLSRVETRLAVETSEISDASSMDLPLESSARISRFLDEIRSALSSEEVFSSDIDDLDLSSRIRELDARRLDIEATNRALGELEVSLG